MVAGTVVDRETWSVGRAVVVAVVAVDAVDMMDAVDALEDNRRVPHRVLDRGNCIGKTFLTTTTPLYILRSDVLRSWMLLASGLIRANEKRDTSCTVDDGSIWACKACDSCAKYILKQIRHTWPSRVRIGQAVIDPVG